MRLLNTETYSLVEHPVGKIPSFHDVPCVSIVPRVAREEDDPASLLGLGLIDIGEV
jgi:hypothetical protein